MRPHKRQFRQYPNVRLLMCDSDASNSSSDKGYIGLLICGKAVTVDFDTQSEAIGKQGNEFESISNEPTLEN